jgi:hypothetical protein
MDRKIIFFIILMLCCSSSSILYILSGDEEKDDPSVGPSVGPSAGSSTEPTPSGPSSSELGDAALAEWEAGAPARAAAAAEQDPEANDTEPSYSPSIASNEAQKKSYEEGLKTNDAGEKASHVDAHPTHNWSGPSMKNNYSSFSACWSDANGIGGGSWVSKFSCCESRTAPTPQRSDGVGWHFCYENT